MNDYPIVVMSACQGNFSTGRQGQAIIGIVDHIMDGTLVGTDAWFQDPASQVSAHYGVGKDGQIHKYVAILDEAYHAGVVSNPTAQMVLDRPGVNPNLYTVGIEHEGMSGDELTDEQYRATLWLHGVLCRAMPSITVDEYHVVRHSTINDQHGGCPGPGFPLVRLLADLKGLV